MPLTNTVDAERKLVIATGTGTLSDEDLLQARRDLLANPLFDAGFDRLWDFSAVTRVELSDDTIGRLVATSPSGEGVCRAVVCTAPETVTRVLEFVAKSRQFNRRIALFPSRAGAEAWIQSQRDVPAEGVSSPVAGESYE